MLISDSVYCVAVFIGNMVERINIRVYKQSVLVMSIKAASFTLCWCVE